MKNNEVLKDAPQIKDFTKRYMLDPATGKFKPAFEELWNQANTLSEFMELTQNDPRTSLERATAFLFREHPLTDALWKFQRSQLGEKSFHTISDAGSLKIGNDSFSILIPNGYGDGTMRCAILESGEFNRDAFEFFTSIEGTLNIYGYDCGDDVVKTITGRFGIYHGNGFVVLERWGDRK